MKKVRAILIVLIIIIVIILIVAYSNKTFMKNNYKLSNSSSIKIPNFSYLVKENDKETIFYTFSEYKNVNSYINKYIDSLKSCYDESYFYDSKADITIKKLIVNKKGIVNKLTLSYMEGNYCKSEFILNDTWAEELLSKAIFSQADIEKCSITNNKCITKNISVSEFQNIYNQIISDGAKRIINSKNISYDVTKDYYVVNFYYQMNKKPYILNIFYYKDNLAFKITDINDASKNAIYDLNGNNKKILEKLFSEN